MSTDNNLRAILLMIVSMCCFSVADALVKLMSYSISPAQVMFYLMAGGLIMFTLIAVLNGDKLADSRAFSKILLLRYTTEISGMVGMVIALATIPIASVGAITQASPLLATVGAVVFLKEHVGWRRWLSITIGFIGVLLIVQPGAIEFDPSVLWALLALVALSARDLTTRLIPNDMSSASMATFTMIAALPFSIAWVLSNGESLIPANTNWFIVIPMTFLGSTGYMFLIASIRMANVSTVMPYRYTRIIFLMVLGVLMFDERPDALMLLGAFLIIASGTYMMWRERRVAGH